MNRSSPFVSICIKLGFTVFTIGIAMAVLSVVVFFISSYAPGDPLQAYYGEGIDRLTSAEMEAARQRLGLDGPVYEQYLAWLYGVVHGDLGVSLKYHEPVSSLIVTYGINTVFLGVLSYGILFVLALVLALGCTLYEGTWVERWICRIGTVFYYIPAFWLGLMVILIFSVNLGLLPSSGAYSPGQSGHIGNRLSHMALPVMTIVMSHVWYYAYLLRSRFLDEVRQEYVLFAKMKGLRRRTVLLRHCLPNVMPTFVTAMALSVHHIIGGAYVIEAVFSYPGLGSLAIESAKYHDYNLLMVIVMVTGFFVITTGMIGQYCSDRLVQRIGGVPWKDKIHFNG